MSIETTGARALPAGLSFRPVDPGTDAAVISAIQNASHLADGLDRIDTPAETASELGNPVGFEVAHDVVVATLAGEPVGVGWVRFVERDGDPTYELSCTVSPGARRRGVGGALLEWQERRAAERAEAERVSRPVWLRTHRSDTSPGATALLEQAGYEPARYFFEMVRPTLDALPALPLPEGLELRPVEGSQYRRIFDATMEAFQDHWGARPATEEMYQNIVSSPELDPALWRVAWEGDEVAGVVSAYIYPVENETLGTARGWLEQVAVRRPWRRRGLASALMVASMEALRDRGMTSAGLGVDAENLTGALGVYERLGFEVTKRHMVLRKSLFGDGPPAA